MSYYRNTRSPIISISLCPKIFARNFFENFPETVDLFTPTLSKTIPSLRILYLPPPSWFFPFSKLWQQIFFYFQLSSLVFQKCYIFVLANKKTTYQKILFIFNIHFIFFQFVSMLQPQRSTQPVIHLKT